MVTVNSGCCGVGLGSAIQRVAVLLLASGTFRSAGTTSSVFALSVRLRGLFNSTLHSCPCALCSFSLCPWRVAPQFFSPQRRRERRESIVKSGVGTSGCCGVVLGTTIQRIAVLLLATGTIRTTGTTTSVFALFVRLRALFSARTFRWESVGRA